MRTATFTVFTTLVVAVALALPQTLPAKLNAPIQWADGSKVPAKPGAAPVAVVNNELELGPVEGGASNPSNTSLPQPFQDLACPKFTDGLFGELELQAAANPALNLKKYITHSEKAGCKRGMWALIDNTQHQSIARTMMKLLGVKRGDHVYDWGSGCGDTLGWMYEWEGIHGFGVELISSAVQYAKATYKEPVFCNGNAADYSAIPDNRFDHALAFGTIFHLATEAAMCDGVKGMLRIVKSGGHVLISYNDETIPKSRWAPCVGNMAEVKLMQSDLEAYGKAMSPYGDSHFTVMLKKL